MNSDVYKAIRAELKVAQFELEALDCPQELQQLKSLLAEMHIEQTILKTHLTQLNKLSKSLWDQGLVFEQALVHLDNAYQAMQKSI